MNECQKKAVARQLCSTHYSRWRKNGTTEKVRRTGRVTCSMDCSTQAQARGLCAKHYARLIRRGSPELGERRPPTFLECAREECSNNFRYFPSEQKKYCSSECYRASQVGKYNYGIRVCHHCEAEYQPTGPMQKYCISCVGPTVYSKGGHSRSEGLVRLKKYGVPHSQWLEWVARYEGACWICRERPAAVLDHCHATGKPRGALCQGCNSQLSGVERHGWLEKATAYLEETKAVTF